MNLQLPLVSVGLPTFNRPKGLKATLARLERQTYGNFEIIVSDNHSESADEIMQIINEFKSRIPNIKYVRQSENIGSLKNFLYLLQSSSAEYFLWVADDDEIEENYIEQLVYALVSHSGAVLSMAGYDVVDRISSPEIRTNLTPYLSELPHEDRFKRMEAFVRQPEYFGKSRLVWGLYRREVLLKCFHESLNVCSERGLNAAWVDLPLEFRALSLGNIVIVDKILWHVYLLPSSDGAAGFNATYGNKLMELCDRSFNAYVRIIQDAPLTDAQKHHLIKILARQNFFSKVRVFVYYKIQKFFPQLARLIKKIWYFFV